MTPAYPHLPSRDEPRSGSWLQTVTQLAGLFAGLIGLVYMTGSVVLSMRLAEEHLPWTTVVSQLPREFVLSIGAGQVLLPSVLVGTLYGLYRILRDDRPQTPRLARLRDGRKHPGNLLGHYVLTWAVLSIPLGAVLLLRLTHSDGEPQTERVVFGLGLLLLAALGVHEVRAVATGHFNRHWSWDRTRSTVVMAGIYVAAAVPAMVLAAAAVPLSDAKICTTDSFEEAGALVGESNQFVYLGEARDEDRRLVVLPRSKVEEMFIGPEAEYAACEPLTQANRHGRQQ